jgi:molybdopterin synthase sulfur carrier subunit
MSIRVLFFASLAEITGMRETSVDASAHKTVGSIFAYFVREFPGLNAYGSSVLFAVNSDFGKRETRVMEGDEVAFFPPVSGG